MLPWIPTNIVKCDSFFVIFSIKRSTTYVASSVSSWQAPSMSSIASTTTSSMPRLRSCSDRASPATSTRSRRGWWWSRICSSASSRPRNSSSTSFSLLPLVIRKVSGWRLPPSSRRWSRRLDPVSASQISARSAVSSAISTPSLVVAAVMARSTSSQNDSKKWWEKPFFAHLISQYHQ